jgi:hypothetical protein
MQAPRVPRKRTNIRRSPDLLNNSRNESHRQLTKAYHGKKSTNKPYVRYKTTAVTYMISRKTPQSNMEVHHQQTHQDDSSSDDEIPEPNPRAPPRPNNRRQGPMGAAPRPFNGDRSQAENFINEVKAYLRLNQETALGRSPRRKVEFVLTFMQGPEVVTWAATIGNWLDTLGDHENIPAVWEAFLDQFFYRFQDSTAQEDARQALTKIRINWPEINQYVADFEELVRKAGYDLDTPMIIDAFLHGLPRTTIKDLVGGTPIRNYHDLRTRAQESVGSHQKLIKLLGIPARRPPSPEETPKKPRCYVPTRRHKRSRCVRKTPAQTHPHHSPINHREAREQRKYEQTRRGQYSTGAVRSEYRKCGTKITGLMQQMTPEEKKQAIHMIKQAAASAKPTLKPKTSKEKIDEAFALMQHLTPEENQQIIAKLDPYKPGDAALRFAMIKHTGDVYMSARKSMTVRTYVHSKSKRQEPTALLDSGATENFINLAYGKWLQLPIKRLEQPRVIINVDGTENKAGALEFYTDLQVKTGSTTKTLRFFLTDLGEHKIILGYPWFAAVQPNVDWKRGWIDHTQLPIIIRAHDAAKAQFLPRTKNVPEKSQKHNNNIL